MNQQSQAQSQAQTQAQLAQMQLAQRNEQNSMLKQQLASQAQSHIQHLNQLLPMHQPPSNTPSQFPLSHQVTPAPEPSSSAPSPPNPPASTTNFDAAELLKQMKETVVSTMKDVAEKTQEKPSGSATPLNLDHPQIPTHPPVPGHPPPAPVFPPTIPPPSPHRRSRSHRHRSSSRHPGKRPISIHRSPLQRRSRRHRSSRPKSLSRRRRRSTSRRRSQDTSVTLRSASPHRRDFQDYRHGDSNLHHSPYSMAHLQPATWNLHEPIPSSSTSNYPQQSDYNPQHYTKWKPWGKWVDWSKSYDTSYSTGQWKDYKKSYDNSNSAGQWIDYSRPSKSDTTHYDDSTKPLTAYSSDQSNTHQHHHRHSHRSGSVHSRHSTLPPGHVPLDLHGGAAEQWACNVKFALGHPDRMRAANEIPQKERPVASTSVDEAEYAKACEELRSLDERIPKETVEKAVKLLFSTYLLPDYDLSTCYTMDLHSANMIALIMPLPDTSKFQMPPPFGNSKNFTWALLHGTTVSGAQQILLEGKIRPANWTYNKDPKRCDLPSFGAFFLGRQVANNDLTIPPWAQQELLCSADKRGKGQQEVIIGAMYHGYEHQAFQAGGNEKAMLRVADIGVVTTSERYTIANSHNVGLKFVAMKWENLTVRPNQIVRKPDRGASSEDDCRYRSIEERQHRQRRRG